MRVQWPDGKPATELTEQQRASLERVKERWELQEPIEVHPSIPASDKAVLINVGPMWLGIEPDGYTHS